MMSLLGVDAVMLVVRRAHVAPCCEILISSNDVHLGKICRSVYLVVNHEVITIMSPIDSYVNWLQIL
jgi:hypothetical protein